VREIMRRALAGEHDVVTAEHPDEALGLLRDEPRDVLVSDIDMPGGGGRRLVPEAVSLDPALAVVVVSGAGTAEDAVEFRRLGAVDYVLKPFTVAAFEFAVARALELRDLREENRRLAEAAGERNGLEQLIGESVVMRDVKDRIRRAAPTQSTVLVTGRSGTGKEVVAHALHELSLRARGPFVAVHAGALPPHLVESELFGHARGAFTGADRARAGRFEEAEGGTLFLDEVGTMSEGAQVRLLRVLAERELTRVGEDKPRSIDVRLVAATNANLREDVAAGRFREDLYFRLAVLPIHMPPLVDREDDVELLARRLLERRCERAGQPRREWSTAALALLRRHHWPGNVREMENVIERALILARSSPVIEASHVVLGPGSASREVARDALSSLPPGGLDLAAHLEQVERRYLAEALARTGGNRQHAADLLRLQRTTLVEKLKRLADAGRPVEEP